MITSTLYKEARDMLNLIKKDVYGNSIIGKEITVVQLESLRVTNADPIDLVEVASCFERILVCLKKMRIYESPDSPVGKQLRELIIKVEENIYMSNFDNQLDLEGYEFLGYQNDWSNYPNHLKPEVIKCQELQHGEKNMISSISTDRGLNTYWCSECKYYYKLDSGD